MRVSTSNRFWLEAAALFLTLLLSAISVLAQEPEAAEAEDAVRSQEDAQQQARDRERAAEFQRQLDLRLQAIENLQGEQGIYAPQLEEAYGELGALYQEFEDFDSAITVYLDALQISRINGGLYNDQQLPIIAALIDSNARLRDWQAADDLQELRYHVSSRLYQPADLDYFAAVEDYGDWKLRVLRENLLDMSYRAYTRSAEDLSEFYQRQLLELEQQPSIAAQNSIALLQGKAEADLVLLRAVASTPAMAFEGTVSRYLNQQRCRNVQNAAGQIVRECVSVQVENPRYRQSQVDAKRFAVSRSSAEVSDSLDKLRQISAQSTELARVEREQLESRIAELDTETTQLLRQSRSRGRFR